MEAAALLESVLDALGDENSRRKCDEREHIAQSVGAADQQTQRDFDPPDFDGSPESRLPDIPQAFFKPAAAQNKNVALLNAIAPYLRSERAAKMESAIKAIQVLGIISAIK